MTIWYLYDKATGVFMGSGTPHFDTLEIGSTETPSPGYNNLPPTWNGTEWVANSDD